MTFLEKVKNEVEPIMAHAIVVLFLQLILVAVGGLIWCLKGMFPSHAPQFEKMESADIWTVFLFLYMFAAYTVIRVAIRLIKGIVQEWQESPVRQ